MARALCRPDRGLPRHCGPPPPAQKEGNVYQVRIDLKLPGDALLKCESGQATEYESLDDLIREAFHELLRQVEDRVRIERGDVKAHEPFCADVSPMIFRGRGYGFLETSDGREIYFHMNNVVDANFEDLTVGTEVNFIEELGDNGPQAAAVTRSQYITSAEARPYT